MHHSAPARVLFADADRDVRTVTAMALSLDERIEVTTCSSPLVAFSLLEAVQPHVIVLELGMPPHDALDLLRTLVDSPQWKDVPVVLMGPPMSSIEVARLSSLGAAGVLFTPFDPMTLARQLSEIWWATQKRWSIGGLAARMFPPAALPGIFSPVSA